MVLASVSSILPFLMVFTLVWALFISRNLKKRTNGETPKANVGQVDSENSKEPSLVLQRVGVIKAASWPDKGLLKGFVWKWFQGAAVGVKVRKTRTNVSASRPQLLEAHAQSWEIWVALWRTFHEGNEREKHFYITFHPQVVKSGLRGIDSPASPVYTCVSVVEVCCGHPHCGIKGAPRRYRVFAWTCVILVFTTLGDKRKVLRGFDVWHKRAPYSCHTSTHD